MERCVLLLVCSVVVVGLDILSPASVARHVASPYNNQQMSPNETISDVGFNTTMVKWKGGYDCADQTIDPIYEGRLVVISDNINSWTMDQTRQCCLCIQAAGGAAVFARYSLPGPQSPFYRLRQRNSVVQCGIPLLASRDIDSKDALTLLEEGENISVYVKADPNPWVDVWDSNIFLVFLRILLPLANGIAVIIAFVGAVSHASVLREIKNDKVIVWLVFGLTLEFIACAIRTVYLAGGPMYSNSYYTWEEHAFLVNITPPFEITTTMIAVIAFRQWTAFGHRNQIGRPGKIFFFSLMGIVFGLEIAGGKARADIKNGVYLTVASAVIYLPITLFASTLFLYRGTRFYFTLKGSFDNEQKTRSLRKAIRWLILSGSASLCLLVSFAFVASKYFWMPWPTIIVLICLITSLTVVSLSHIFAFFPQYNRKPKPKKLLKVEPHIAKIPV